MQGIVVTAAGICVPEAFALTFEEYKKLRGTQFDDYQAKFRAAQLVYRQEIRQFWLEAKLSDHKTFVHYFEKVVSRWLCTVHEKAI